MQPNNERWKFRFLPQGALIQEFLVSGQNIVLGLPTADLYRTHNSPYFGETIGRTTNRIKDGRIENLNETSYQVPQNDNGHSLHGGREGWGKKIFHGPTVVERRGVESIHFSYLSKHSDEGYPGTVECRVWYTQREHEDGKITLGIEHEVELVGNECDETIVYLSNHSYFNLNPGAATIDGTLVQLITDKYLEVDSKGIPTGKVLDHPSVSLAAAPCELGASRPVFDNCFVVDAVGPWDLDTRSKPLQRLAQFSHPASGICLEISSTEPAFQFYTGDGIHVPPIESTSKLPFHAPGSRGGFAIEPGRFVDAQRQGWRTQSLLKKGQLWGAYSQFCAWKEHVA